MSSQVLDKDQTITSQPSCWDTSQGPSFGFGGNRLLNALVDTNQLLLEQKVLGVFERGKEYFIRNALGHEIFSSSEDVPGYCSCTPLPWDIVLKNSYHQDAIHISRIDGPCTCVCCADSRMEMLVTSPTGSPIGFVVHEWGSRPKFSILNAAKEHILKISGPMFVAGESNFKVNSLNGIQIGNIQRQYDGILKELWNMSNRYSITFPADLEMNMKAVLLAACLTIDIQYFDGRDKNHG